MDTLQQYFKLLLEVKTNYKKTRNACEYFIIPVFCGWLIVYPVSANGQQQNDRQADIISDQLFAESVHLLGGIRNPVLRWYENVNIALIDDTKQQLLPSIISILHELSLLTGIDYRHINHELENGMEYLSRIESTPAHDLSLCDKEIEGYCANFVVIVTGQEIMHKITQAMPMRPVFRRATRPDQRVPCFFSPGFSSDLQIKRSIVYVQNTLDKDMLLTCLNEEIYQSFGLFGDYSDSNYFSFNNQVKPKAITYFDKALITSLYDGEFQLGVSAGPIARQFSEYCRDHCF